MTRKQKRPIALLAALTMVMSMVLNFPSGCFGITASAVTAEVPTNMFLGISKICNPKAPTAQTDGWSGSYVYFGDYTRLNSTIADKWLKYRVLSNSTSDFTSENCMLLESAYVFFHHDGGQYSLDDPEAIAY